MNLLEWLKKSAERLAATAHQARVVIENRWSWMNGRPPTWALAIPLGIGAGLAGPFGTFDAMPLMARFIYWLVVMLMSFAVWYRLERFIAKQRPDWGHVPVAVVTALPFAFFNAIPIQLAIEGMAKLAGQAPWTSYLSLVSGHLLFSLLVVTPSIWIVKRLLDAAETVGRTDAIQFLIERLPARLRPAVPFALAAEGAYVRVYTPRGDDLVSMRFDDALRSVSGIEGVQTHRSWWVATAQITEIHQAGSAYEAKTNSGLAVPVSRRRYKEVLAAAPTSADAVPPRRERDPTGP